MSSQAALARAEAQGKAACQREDARLAKPRLHIQAQRFETPEAAQAAWAARANPWQSHPVEAFHRIEHPHDARPGKPPSTTPRTAMDWQIHVQVRPDQEPMAYRTQHHACLVLGTNIEASQLSEPEVMQAYKSQAQAEGGFRLRKDPRFCVASLFLNKPCRIHGLLLVMTLALLVYAVRQRRWRQQLARHHETVPNQINQPTERPTWRWVFPLLEGLHRVRVTVPGQVHDLIEGLTEGHIKILRLCGEEVCRLDQISPG